MYTIKPTVLMQYLPGVVMFVCRLVNETWKRIAIMILILLKILLHVASL